MRFDVGAWMKDPAISSCSEATRGIWVDLLCAMFESDQCGRLANTMPVIARLGRTTVPKLRKALAELDATKSADVTFCDALVTITNRKMRREYQIREAARLRKEKSRKKKSCHADVTTTSEIRGNKLDVRSKNYKHPSTRRSAAKPADVQGSDSGVRLNLTEEVLRTPAMLERWLLEESARTDAWVSASEVDRFNVNATAAKALRAKAVRSPVGLFKWIVRGKRWEYLRFDDDKLAATMLASETAKERASVSEFVDVPKLELPRDAPRTPADVVKQIKAAVGHAR